MKITCVFILLFLFHLNINAQSDCPDAIIVCGDANYFDLEAEGIGQTPEISPDNACASGENNTIWLKIQINQGGTLGFVLTPMGTAMEIDFDFWMFGPIEQCSAIGTAIRCSTTNPLQANLDYITTGMNETETDSSEGPGPDGNGFVQWITVQDNEFYYLVIDRPHGFGNFSIEWTGTATFHAVPQFLNPNNIPLDLVQCDKDGINDQSTPFDLTVHEAMFIGTQSPVEVTYHENLNDATIGEDPIATPEAYVNTSNPQTIYLRMTNIVTGCYSTETFTLNVTPPIIAGQPQNMELCDIDKNGIQTFNLSFNDPFVIGDNPESFVTYHTSLQDAKDGTNAVGPLFENETLTQTIWARLQDAEGCFSYDFNSFTISILPLPTFNNTENVILDLNICENSDDDLTAVFDLTQYKDMLIGDQTNVILTYHEDIDQANAGDNEIVSPSTYTNTASPQTIYMRLANIETACYDILPFTITVYGIKAGEPENMVYCDLDDDGLHQFDLALNDDAIKDGTTDSNVTYYSSFEDAESKQAAIGPLYQTTVPYSTETIWARLERTTPVCVVYDIKSFTVSVKPLPVFNNPENISFDLYKCDTDGIDDQSTPFNLTTHAGTMIGTQSDIETTYYNNIVDAENGQTHITTPNAYPNTSNPQTIYVRLTNTLTGCFRVTSFELHILPAPQAYTLPDLKICDDNNDGTAFFNLDPIIQSIQNTISNTVVTIHETPEDAIFGQNVITDTSAYPNNELNTQTLYIRVESTLTHCFDTTTLQLIVNPLPEVITPSPYALCDDGASDSDGRAIFNLTIKKSEVLGSLDPALYSVNYYLTLADAQAGTPVIGNPLTYLSASGEVYIKVSNNTTGCFKIVPLKLIVNPLPSAVQPIAPYRLCDVTAPLKDGIEVFDLETVIPAIIGAQQGLVVTFHHSYADAQGNTGAIATPNAYPSGPAVETLFVRVTVEATGCYRIVLQDLKVEPLPIILAPTQDMLTVCDTDGNGIGEFNLESLIEGMKNGEPDLDITFHHTLLDAQAGNNAIGNTTEYINADPYLEFFYVRVVNTKTGCSDTYRLTLIVEPAPQAPALTPLVLCDTDANNQDLKTYFDLTQKDADIYQALNVPVGSLTIHYFINEASANAGAPRITTPAHYLGTDGQVIWVRVESIANNCFSLSSFVLKVNKPLALTTPSVLAICNEALPNDGQAVFDLTVKNNEILGPLGIGKGYTVTYYETDPKVTTPPAVAIATPTAYTNPAPPAGNPKTQYVVVTSKEGCKSYTTLTIKVLPLPMPDTTPDALVKCNEDNSTDGKEEFDLTEAEADIRNNDNQSIVTYYILQSDAEAGTNKIPDPTAYVSGNGSVWVRMEANTNNPNDPKCYQVVELKLVVNPLPAIGDANGKVPAYAICEANTDGIAEFDLNSHIEAILGANAATDYDIEFYLDQAALDAGTALPRLYTNATPNSQTILVVVTHKETGCKITKSLDLLVEESAIANPIVNTTTPLFECDDDGVNDGFHEFDLTVVEAEVLGAQNPTDYKVTYHLSEADANDNTQPQGLNPVTSPTTFINTIKDGQRIWVRVTNMSTVSKCHDITFFDVEVEQLPEPKLEEGTICVDKITDEVLRTYEITTGLDATHSFEWKKGGVVIAGETGPSLVVDAPGIYSVIAKSANGCESAEVSTEVFQSGPAAKVGVGYYVSNAFSDVQTITVEVEGYGVYQYKLDEGPWQDSPVFTDVSPGTHTVTVRDITENSCEDLIIKGVNLIDYPNFFTPNGDGFRDTWNIIGLDQPDAKIYIFDRYGKLLKQISAVGDGWDGTYNGENLPATDYWFTVTYREIVGYASVTKEFKAHFSLLR